MAKGDCGPLEGTLIALQEAKKRLAELLQLQCRAIEATGRPDPALAKKLAFWKYTCESLRGDQLDHEMLIRPAIEGERVARQRKEAARSAAEQRRRDVEDRNARILRDAVSMLDAGTDEHNVAAKLARRYRLDTGWVRTILKKRGFYS